MAVVPEKQIKKNNLDAHISTLSRELEEKRLGLEKIVSREAAHKVDTVKLEKNKQSFLKEQEIAHATLDKRTQQIVEREQALKKKDEEMTQFFFSLQQQIKEGTKNLAKINNSCINGNRELEEMSAKKVELEKKLLELTHLVLHYEEMRLKVKTLEEEKGALENDIENKQVAWDNDLTKAKQELEAISKAALEKIDERNKAEYAVKAYTDQLYTSMNDWQIIRTRLETRWKEHYPELELPIAE